MNGAIRPVCYCGACCFNTAKPAIEAAETRGEAFTLDELAALMLKFLKGRCPKAEKP